MMPYSGQLFFYVMGLLLIPAIILGMLEKPLKWYGMFFTAVMLLWTFGENGQIPALLIFTFWQMGLCCLSFRLKNRWKQIRWLLIALSVLPLVLVKVGEIWHSLSTLGLLGISYMSFRSVQVILDVTAGRLGEMNLFDLLYFILFFPSIASGPIDRYRRFESDLKRRFSRIEYVELLRKAIWRLELGAFFTIVVSDGLWNFWLAKLPDGGFGATVLYMYGYTLFLFFNFAGYSSMAIGTSYILGICLPENFNMPFFSVDMKDFWSRWHISLSSWLRDYVYTGFVRSSLKAKRFKNPRTASYLGYIITMMIMGIWHGFISSYLLYGVYHSVLMCINEALDLHSKSFRKLKRQKWGQVVLVIITFHLFSFGLLIFSGRLLGG